MKFCELLNDIIVKCSCTASDLCSGSDISPSTLRRYRSGERVPSADSKTLAALTAAIASIAEEKNIPGLDEKTVMTQILACDDILSTRIEDLLYHFDTLLTLLSVSTSRLSQKINYDASTISRFRSGQRQPAEPLKFAKDVADIIAQISGQPEDLAVLAKLLACSEEALVNEKDRAEKINHWILYGPARAENTISTFLSKIDDFDLNEYIKAIHFDEMKVPTVPFQIPSSRTCFGLKEMMEAELDFMKATVLSKSMEPVTMYSDMPLEEMAKDPEFPKKWMFGLAMMLKKGLHLNMIHNIDRPFAEMMLGLESWIPMYMTGQISPYYLKGVQSNVFLHFLKVSDAAALSGEAISDHQADGKYYLTKSRKEISYYKKRAEQLLQNAHSLMDIYREDRMNEWNAFLLSDARTSGKRRNILSAPPLYTMDADFLTEFLAGHNVADPDASRILAYQKAQQEYIEEILQRETITEEIPVIDSEEFGQYPVSLSLSGMFYDHDLSYSYDDYLAHMDHTRAFADSHPNYKLLSSSTQVFRNLQIRIHEDHNVMISKDKSPAVHFVIHHPKLRSAIENFVPPVIE